LRRCRQAQSKETLVSRIFLCSTETDLQVQPASAFQARCPDSLGGADQNETALAFCAQRGLREGNERKVEGEEGGRMLMLGET